MLLLYIKPWEVKKPRNAFSGAFLLWNFYHPPTIAKVREEAFISHITAKDDDMLVPLNILLYNIL